MTDDTTESLHDHDALLGTVLDSRFALEEVLGAGGMGTVFLARQLSIDRAVAVKVLEEKGDAVRVERFLREARVIAAISHPNVVQVVDFGRREPDGLLYLVMEYVDGTVLSDLLRLQRLHPNLAIEIAAQIASGLGAAHAQHIIHRDLKPENVIVSVGPDGSVLSKVLDFGVAHVFEERDLTFTGQVCGTPAYMAPEQVRGEEVTPATDVYSLGLTLYQMLGGLRPFAGSPLEVAVKQVHSTIPSLRALALRNEVPEPLIELCERMMAKDAGERPPSGSAARDALLELRESLGERSVRLDPRAPWNGRVHPAYASHGGDELLLGAQVPAPWGGGDDRVAAITSPDRKHADDAPTPEIPAVPEHAGADWAAFRQHQTGPHTRPAAVIDPNLEVSERFQLLDTMSSQFEIATAENTIPDDNLLPAYPAVEAPDEPIEVAPPTVAPRAPVVPEVPVLAPIRPEVQPTSTTENVDGARMTGHDAVRTALVMLLTFVIVMGVGLVIVNLGARSSSTESSELIEAAPEATANEPAPDEEPLEPDDTARATKRRPVERRAAQGEGAEREEEPAAAERQAPIDLFDGPADAEPPTRPVVIEEAEW